MKCSQHIFNSTEIDCGFASDAAVNHSEQRCRNVYVVNTAHINTCRKSADVAYHASAEVNDYIFAA